MKRFRNLFVTFCMIITMLTPVAVFADGNNAQSGEIQPRSDLGKTVTDRGKNRYYVSAHSSRNGKNVIVQTNFSVSYYYGGTGANKGVVDSYTKNLSVNAQVALHGGGGNTLSGSAGKTGASNSYSKAQTYLYNVSAVSASHGFSCNGGSTSIPTSA
ncbi:hypothetical protein [Ruminococcus gauvreauii]|uniref:Secreted protein n=1 Tax=Ruminococcus gauvreauii TaxID=438033 RepID=A0ABY5VIU8_9FIRM|nr:hypothetical protein [Ruminococcus gauvreauii]UWP60520.1 hypothetical protein NQ502_05645 [Ruminococcus gauvreauii]